MQAEPLNRSSFIGRWAIPLQCALGLAVCGALAAKAQDVTTETAPKRERGTVAGRVVCTDTQAAARLAHIFLIPVQPAPDESERFSLHPNAETTTTPDGNFVFASVIPGRYYVIATLPGYRNTGAEAVEEYRQSQDLAGVLARLPVVVVAAGAAATSTTVSIQPGATLQGEVRWQDGTAAANINVLAEAIPDRIATPPALARLLNVPTVRNAETDSAGHFRITSLPSGTYRLPVSWSGSSTTAHSETPYSSTLTSAYAPGVFFARDAENYEVANGTTHADIAIKLDLTGLHRVSGTVHAALPGVRLAGGGVLVYTDGKADDTAQLMGGARLNSQGEFLIQNLPPGRYKVKADPAWANESGELQRDDAGLKRIPFQQSGDTVVVGQADQSNVYISLLPLPQPPL